jgi:hypothetical protein
VIDVAECTALPVPADVIIAAARRHLGAIDAGDGADPCASPLSEPFPA